MDLIGEQYHVMMVLTNAGATLGAGGVDNYSALLTTRCSLRSGSGSRNNSFAEISGNSSWRIVCRYQDTLWNAITMSMKFQIDGVRYTLQSWEKFKERRKDMILFNVTAERNG